MALWAKTEECASKQSKPRKRCEERKGDDVIEKPFERMCGRMHGHGHLGGQLRARKQMRHSECQSDKSSTRKEMFIGN